MVGRGEPIMAGAWRFLRLRPWESRWGRLFFGAPSSGAVLPVASLQPRPPSQQVLGPQGTVIVSSFGKRKGNAGGPFRDWYAADQSRRHCQFPALSRLRTTKIVSVFSPCLLGPSRLLWPFPVDPCSPLNPMIEPFPVPNSPEDKLQIRLSCTSDRLPDNGAQLPD